MKLRQDGLYPGRMYVEFSKIEFNTVMSMLQSVSSFYKDNPGDESKTMVPICESLIRVLIKYSKIDVQNEIVILFIFPKELGLLMSFIIVMADSSNDIDYFNKYVDSGGISII